MCEVALHYLEGIAADFSYRSYSRASYLLRKELLSELVMSSYDDNGCNDDDDDDGNGKI